MTPKQNSKLSYEETHAFG